MPFAESSESRSIAITFQCASMSSCNNTNRSSTFGAARKSLRLQRGKESLPSLGENQADRHSNPNSCPRGKRTASSVAMPLPVIFVQ